VVEGRVNALLVLPKSDWTLISRRAGLVTRARDSAPMLGRYLPAFKPLAAACQTWRRETFPALVNQAAAIGRYAEQAIKTFTELQARLRQLAPGGTLPEELQQQARTSFTLLALSTMALAQQAVLISTDVLAFTSANQLAEARHDSFRELLGANWESIAPSLLAVDRAVEQQLAGWQRLKADVHALATGQRAISGELLRSLGLDAALLGWRALRDDAAVFAHTANSLGPYLVDGWPAPVSSASGVARRARRRGPRC
jgi:hypothetical protein